MSMAPFSQFALPSIKTIAIQTDVSSMVAVSKKWKFIVIGLFKIQPSTTQSGMTKTEICTADPTALPSAISILFLYANTIAAACSAAFPTIGTRMPLMKRIGMPRDVAAPSIASTIHSDRVEMKTVIIPSQATPPQKPRMPGSSCSSSSSSGSNRCECVPSWKKMRSAYMSNMATATNREYQSGASPPGRFSASRFPPPFSQLGSLRAFNVETTGTLRLTTMISAWELPAPECVSSRMEGKDNASTANIRRPVLVTAADLLKRCSLCL
mmetsp:Transcript_61271/g.114588  ORF Transcript_61271/g.114588 Transcript_61271/m.114588 type:complete len:268 (+) Transcript_61271:80-883(+)